MRFSWMLATTVLLVLATGARCKRKFDGDFEFAEEVSQKFLTLLPHLASAVRPFARSPVVQGLQSMTA